MKTLLTLFAAAITFTIVTTSAYADRYEKRHIGYDACGHPVYTWVFVRTYDHCDHARINTCYYAPTHHIADYRYQRAERLHPVHHRTYAYGGYSYRTSYCR